MRTRLIASYMLAAATALLGSTAGVAQPVDRRAANCEDPFGDVSEMQFSPAGWTTDFCRNSVNLEEIVSGGLPRDGIPPIDDPKYVSTESASDWIDDREPVILVRVGDDARAYPLQILTWHEIVNTTVGDVPLAVTFCPLCYAAIVFERPEVEGARLTFGTTGNLRKSDLVMWDRQTESWWQQFSGESIVGTLTGMVLDKRAAPLVSWEEFRTRFPKGLVLSKITGHSRPYGENPYVGYDDVSKTPWLYDGPVGSQLRPMDRVVGLEVDGEAAAFELRSLRRKRVRTYDLAGNRIVVFWSKGTVSAVDSRSIPDGREIGSTGAFLARIDGRDLTFTPHRKGSFKDEETGSTWNGLGESIDGPLRGSQLEPVVHHNVFWFVWSAFQPDGTLVNGE